MNTTIPKTGAYKKRAILLRGLLAPLIREAFGDQSCVERGKPEEPTFVWELSQKVTLKVERAFSADPEITVDRRDPFPKDSSNEQDWKHERFTRSQWDGHLEKIIQYAKDQVEYNRARRTELEFNARAMEEELAGWAGAKGVNVERNHKDGRYNVTVSSLMKGLSLEETKSVLSAIESFKKETMPLEGSRCERCGARPPEGEYFEENWLPGNVREKVCPDHRETQ